MKQDLTRYSIRELGPETWTDFAELVEKHNGIWGGCWCIAFHLKKPGDSHRTPMLNRRDKENLVRTGSAHAALVYEAGQLDGWCQFGSPAELPARIAAYSKLGLDLPDWRITCFFVDRDHRKAGVAETALGGALQMIAIRGGGTVDGYPIVTRGKLTSNSFLGTGTASIFEAAGFHRIAATGISKWIMRREVGPIG
jgi:GNAT superfamily N-acetyltransferase